MSGELTAAAKGCVIQATNGNPGYYRVHGLRTEGPIFVQQVSTNRKDIVAAISCFANKHRFFVFGKGFGDITITLEAFLGNRGTKNAESAVNAFFESNRSASLLAPITVTSRGGGNYSFFLTGCRVVATNPDNNSIQFQLLGKLVE